MNRKAIADAANKISEGFAEFALAIEQSGSPDVPAAGEPVPPRSDPAPAASTALGVCPKHRVSWSVKEGGISKNGKPYKAFWKCNEKDPDTERGYCQQKPDPAWARTHSAEQAAMDRMDEEVPF